MNLFKQEIILENDFVILRPLSPKDCNGFRQIAFDKDIWLFNVTKIWNDVDLDEFISIALKNRENETRYPFTIFEKKSGGIVGSTSYGNISLNDKRLEIGWTWLGMEFQGKGINQNCKYLLLDFAFNELGIERVGFKTDVLNIASRKALQKIGATEEGILRSHTLMHDGRRRDTIYYSILKHEWNKRAYF